MLRELIVSADLSAVHRAMIAGSFPSDVYSAVLHAYSCSHVVAIFLCKSSRRARVCNHGSDGETKKTINTFTSGEGWGERKKLPSSPRHDTPMVLYVRVRVFWRAARYNK